MTALRINDEVFYSTEPVPTASRQDIERLKEQAAANPRQRARLCTHPHAQALLHEMLIALTDRSYVRPHAHLRKAESYHILEGAAALVLFDEQGSVTRVIALGPIGSEDAYYVRVNPGQFHCLLARSPSLVFQESTTGPFDPQDTMQASWAPEEQDQPTASAYRDGLLANSARL